MNPEQIIESAEADMQDRSVEHLVVTAVVNGVLHVWADTDSGPGDMRNALSAAEKAVASL